MRKDGTPKRTEEQSVFQTRLLDTVGQAVIATKPDGTIAYWNRAAETLYGWSAAEVLGRNVVEVIVPEVESERAADVMALLRTGQSWSGEFLVRRRDGRTFQALVTHSPVFDEQGALVGLVGVSTDTTERKRIADALHQSEERYRRLVELSPDGIAIHSEGRLVFVNPAATRILGASQPDELLGRPILDLVHPDCRPMVTDRLRQLEHGEQELQAAEEKFVRLDGTTIDVEVVATRLGYDGKLATQIILHDITERKRTDAAHAELEEQLRRAQLLDAIGRLAGGVAHDFNNQLTIIKARAQFLLDGLPADAPLYRHAERIAAMADRGTRLVRKLLAFSSEQPSELQTIDLTQLVHEMAPMLRLLLGAQISLQVKAAPDLWPVRAHPVQIERLIMNLVANARDAVEGVAAAHAAIVTLETANIGAGEAATALAAQPLSPGAHVLLAVSDTGCGMSAEVQEHMFEPFFTTKPLGKGTGLGLWTAFSVVQQHGGDIVCHSQPGQGTQFRIYLPTEESNERAGSPGTRRRIET